MSKRKPNKVGEFPTNDIIKKLITERSKKDENSDCINWNGYSKNGYCQVTYKENRVTVIKFLYHQKFPEWKGEDKLARNCDNEKCVNVDHLVIKKDKNNIDYNKVWDRLVSKSTIDSKGCRIWNGSKNPEKYGKTAVKGKHYSVHRLSYLIKNNNCETIPEKNEKGEKLMIRHLCNINDCFEPTHLKLGTYSQNNKEDKIASGTFLQGDTHHSSKITSELAKLIKHSKGEGSMNDRAKKFNIPISIVKSIDRNVSWCHIPDKNDVISNNRDLENEKRNDRAKQRSKYEFKFDDKTLKTIYDKITNNTIESQEQSPHVNDKCLLWTKASYSYGYGYFVINNRKKASHIWNYEWSTKQVVPDNLIVRHLCNIKLCCKLSHLIIGNGKDNALDYINSNQNKNITNTNIISEIRSTYLIDNLSLKQRCEKYNLKPNNLKSIENYSTFSHIIVLDVNTKVTNGTVDITFDFGRYNTIITNNINFIRKQPEYII